MKFAHLLTILFSSGFLYSQDVTLSFGPENYLGMESAEILIENSEAVYGFQFNVSGINIISSTAGDVVPGDWMLSMSGNLVLGFSLMGTSFPSGSGVLVNLTYEETGGDVCIQNGIVSGLDGVGLEVGYGGCMPTAPMPAQVDLSITGFDGNLLEINMSNSEEVAGFQFDLESSFPDFQIVSVSGGTSAENNFMVSNSDHTIIGFSLTGDVIPPGDGALVFAEITFTGESGSVQIVNSVFSESNGNALVVNNGDPFLIEVELFTDGCSDPDALNYEAEADGCTEDDPSDFSCCEYPIENHFNVDLAETGEFQLVIFQSSISILDPGDEIGVFDANGVTESTDAGDDPVYGEVLVGAGLWTGEQLNISAIMSVDLSDFGGPVLNGAVDGNPVVVKIYKQSEDAEYIVQNITWQTGSGNFGDLMLVASELELTPPHFDVELEETGEFQLVILESSISILDPGDEVGIFDANGVVSGGMDPVYGEVLVGAGAWSGDQLSISAIMSVDLSDFGGPVLNGAVDGNPVIIKVWKAAEEMEYSTSATWSAGSGNFGDLILAISELSLQDGYDIIINEFFFRATMGTSVPDYVELYNIGSEEIDLNGWTIDGEELSGSVAPGGFLLIAGEDPFFNADGDELYAGEDIPNSVFADISLSTSSDDITLIDASGNTVAELSYDDDEGWPVGNDNRGHAAELTDPDADIADPSNWVSVDSDCTSDYLYGEDGADEDITNFGSPTLANCNGPQPDCAGVVNGDANSDDCDVCICGDSGLGDCVDQEPNADLDCSGECFGDAVEDDCGICEGDGSSCAAYVESEITTTVDETLLEDLESFEEDFESYIETALDLPDGTVEVTSITILRDEIEIVIEYTITLTEEELEETDFGSSEDIEDALEEVEDDIETGDDDESGGLDFVYGCADDTACNYDPEVTVDDGSCSYPEGTCDCDGNPTDGYCACDGSMEDDCGVCDNDPENDNADMDCADVCFGDSYEDDCGVCDDNPGNDNADQDCSGDCFGDSYEDICGDCDDNSDNDNLECSGCTDPLAFNYDEDALADCSANPGGDDVSCCDYSVEVEYDIAMHNGSNLISFYALPEDNSVANIMADLGECVTGVIGEGVAASHLGGGTWVGSLSEIESTSGYWVKLNDNCTLHVVGIPFDPPPVYELHTGSNLISFPYGGIIGLSTGIPDEVEPIFIGVIGEGVAASQIAPFTWVGSLSQWEGTKGYWAKVNEPFTFSFVEPGLLMSNSESIEEEIPEPIEINQSTEQAFYFVNEIQTENYPKIDEGLLKTYCNGQLVGSREWIGEWIDIPAMGDDGDWITDGYCQPGNIPEFTILNLNTGEEIKLTGSIPQWETNGLFIIETLTEVVPLPNQITLNNAYPNPFNPATQIEFGLPFSQQVLLIIYDITGREVTTLINGMVESGFHRVQWNGTDNTGRPVSAGVYTVVLNSSEASVSRKMVFLK